MGRRGSHLARIGAVIGLATLVAGVHALPAAAVVPGLTLPPERLYTTVDLPIAFTGADPISGDDRAIVVTATDDSCAPADGNDWSLDGCARVQLDVAHGELAIPLQTTLGGVGEPDGIASGGAIVDQSTNGDGTGLVVHVNGTQDQLNDALALLTYTPDSGYEYDGTNPETLGILVADGTTPADNVSHDVEIFVEQVNDGPDLTVPSEAAVAAGGTVSLPAAEPPVGTNGDLFVEDPDIEDGEADDEMLVVMVASCGQFALRGGALTLGQTIEELLTNEGLPQLAIDAILAGLPSEVTSQMFATGSPTDWREGLAAIVEYDELNYALSQVGFQAPATDGTCDLWTIVTDLGNNGLPLQYVGSPLGGRDDPKPGVEIPVLGVDLGITSFVVGEGVELSLPTNLSIAEGSTLPIPVATSSAMHPAIDLDVTATGITAVGGVDFTAPATDQVFPENDAGPLTIDLPTTGDPDDEPDETAFVTIALDGMPPGVTIANDSLTVTIVDDDAPAPDTTDPTVTIDQGATQVDPTSTSPITFDVVFSEPVTGFAASDVDLSASTAGGTLVVSTITGGPSAYTVEVSGMTTAGTVVATVFAGSASDAAGNLNDASTSTDNTVTWAPPPPDTTNPTVSIDQGATQVDPTSTSPITFDIVFSEPVTGLAPSDIDLSASTAGGTLVVSNLTGSGATYTAQVSGMTTSGTVVATIPAASASDGAGNLNDASISLDNTVTWAPPADTTGPVGTIDEAPGQLDPTDTAPITFRITFDEPVTGLTASDIDLTASTVGGTLVPVVTEIDAATYDVAITGMTTAGDVVIDLPAAAVQDLAANASGATLVVDDTVEWAPAPVDATAPTVTVEQAVGQPDPTSLSPILFTVEFSEPVFVFDETDLSFAGSTVGGTLSAVVTGAGPTYGVAVTGMTTDGDVVLSVPAAQVVDGAGNANTASTSIDDVVTWVAPDPGDTTSPTVTLEQAADQPDPTSVAPIRFVATFSEPVTGFDVDDLLLDGSTVGGVLSGQVQPRTKADGTSFDIVVTGMTTPGDLVLSVVGGAATDAAGNPSLASSSSDNVVAWLAPVDVIDDGIDDYGYYYDGYDGTSYDSGGDHLARTGTDLSVVLVIGVGTVGLGLGLVLVARRPWGRTG